MGAVERVQFINNAQQFRQNDGVNLDETPNVNEMISKLKLLKREKSELFKENQKLKKTITELQEPEGCTKKTEEKASSVLGIEKKTLDVLDNQSTESINKIAEFSKLLKKIKQLNSRIEAARFILIHHNNEMVKDEFVKCVNLFNTHKSKLIELKILEHIIELNKQNIQPSQQKLLDERTIYISHFEKNLLALKDVSNQLKELLKIINPTDTRLQNKSYWLFASEERIFTLPGGEDFKVSDYLKEVPKEWVYQESLAFTANNNDKTPEKTEEGREIKNTEGEDKTSNGETLSNTDGEYDLLIKDSVQKQEEQKSS